ncbi:hypothetical protein NUU61_004611 [Penicillium alfredii]|uniref:Uncharacterized protein n=1 Tax=Penicillium alfredii TaxID=1506179 RepID=A0A9W9KDI7_9EURO|nr:uncharacterized protein NUU61_004611 [Penicillium alfredii]KAJ5102389.1 hypothetical protein NUU61_004611 [Penicillium alfredii]
MISKLAYLLTASLAFWGANALPNSVPNAVEALESRADGYHVVVTDQHSRTVRVFPRNAQKWDSDAVTWQFTADATFPWVKKPWNDLSDVRIRKTAQRGLIALVAASGGKVGIVDISSKRRTGLHDLIWQATPGDNPHALERIPYVGALVSASSTPGKLTLYAPPLASSIDDFKNYRTVESYDVDFAHAVLWDPQGNNDPDKGFLWALGRDYLHQFRVKGRGQDTRLVRVRDPISLPPYKGTRNGHDLQPDYHQPGVLLLTHTSAAYEFNTSTRKFKELTDKGKLKSLVRHSSGEYVWVQSSKGSDMGHYVSFSENARADKPKDSLGWDDAEFYKARIYSPDYA